MKICFKCKIEKTEAEFHKRKDKRDGLDPRCKPCKKIYNSERYKNSPTLAIGIKKRQTVKNLKNRLHVRLFLLKNPCIDCGEADPIVLDFDHKDPAIKLCNISTLCTRTCSIKKLELEMKKCDIRCANCHRKRTAKQYNWYAALDAYKLEIESII